MTLGLMLPMAQLSNGVPDMTGQLDLAVAADRAGFATLWIRDVPLFDPGFNDAGQVYDPWVWLGQLATVTQRIALSAAGIVLPLRHPLHTAKAAASVDVISGGGLLGAASGDRAAEYPAFGRSHEERGAIFREAIEVICRATSEDYPALSGSFGEMHGLDLIPKATGRQLADPGGRQRPAEHPVDLAQSRWLGLLFQAGRGRSLASISGSARSRPKATAPSGPSRNPCSST